MKTSIVAASVFALSALAAPLQAQLVSADVVVRTGPVRGHVVIGDDRSTYHRRPDVVYERPARVVIVERFGRHGHPRHHWKRQGYRQVKVYYVGDRYYDRYDVRRPGVREVVVYERGGRYYRDDDDRDRRDYRDRRDDYRDRDRDRDRDHGRGRGRGHDRWDD
jgi:hypothetical protein